MSCFRRSLARGRVGEAYVFSALERAGFAPSWNDGEPASHDVRFTRGGVRHLAEVKFDVMASRTGNWAVEFMNTNSGRPSGIKGTKADVWIQVLADPMRAYAVTVTALRQFFDSTTPYRELWNVGDGNAAIRLYKECDIMPVFTPLEEFLRGMEG